MLEVIRGTEIGSIALNGGDHTNEVPEPPAQAISRIKGITSARRDSMGNKTCASRVR
jgi:hypothetical protein